MKLITLNTHSLLEEQYEKKLNDFVDAIIREQPDVFALQEVNQSRLGQEICDVKLCGYVAVGGTEVVIREDNHALSVAKLLKKSGVHYEWTWLPIKKGYDDYEEGIALFSRSSIVETRGFYVSSTRDYNNWRSRKVVGIKNQAYADSWFFSAHFGWWDDVEDPFSSQWEIADYTMKDISNGETCYVMGDFNIPDSVPEQGLNFVKNKGWHDTWELAVVKDSGRTVGHVIDGWHDRVDGEASEFKGMRLDYIWCNKKVDVISSEVVFNGKLYNIVSDHYGVMTELENI